MSSSTGASHFADAMTRIQASPDALTVVERRGLVKAIADAFRGGGSREKALVPLIYQLVEDPKWEVRQDLADILLFVPDEHFAALAARLAQDDNRYVRTAAERSMERQRRTEMEAERASRGMSMVTSRFESFAKRHGEAAAVDAMQLSDEHLGVVGKEIAHDLLNLLAPLKEYARSLQSDVAENPAAVDAAAWIFEGLELLHRSVRDIQAYCEPVPFVRHMEQLNDLIGKADELARENVRQDGGDPNIIDVTMDVPADIRLPVSRHAIINAFMNILKNAYEACEAKTGQREIDVRAEYAADSIRVSIEDTGVGLSDENLRKVKTFLPGRKNMTKKRSTGYGLLKAKRGIEAHEGSLDIHSRLNHGTTVIVSFPLAVEAAEE